MRCGTVTLGVAGVFNIVFFFARGFAGACALPAGAIGSSGTKHGTAVREEGDQAFFANGEYFPFAIDTTQYSYYAVVRCVT